MQDRGGDVGEPAPPAGSRAGQLLQSGGPDSGRPSSQGKLGLGRQACLGLAIGCGVLGAALLLGGVAAYRMGALDLAAAREGARGIASQVFLAGLVFAGLGGIWSVLAKSSRGVILSILAMLVCGTGYGWLYGQSLVARSLPPLWDLQTDWSRPIAFSTEVMAARAREGAPPLADAVRLPAGPEPWAGQSVVEAQAEAFPGEGLQPLILDASPDAMIVEAEASARRMGWRVTLSNSSTGRLEAVATSPWFGLRTDIVVQAGPDGVDPSKTRLDIRAAARAPGGDAAVLAERIISLRNDVAFALRGAAPGG